MTANMPTSISEDRFRQVFNIIERHIEMRYGIPIIIADVPHPFTGDLDGTEIQVDYDLEIEEAVFVVAHLFGHTVQWNRSEEARRIGRERPQNPSADWLRRLREYEVEACRYSLQMFHDAGIRDLDQWLSDFAACDWLYLEHFYRTGEKQPFTSFWRDRAPLLQPLPIPPFQPHQWLSRWEGIVV